MKPRLGTTAAVLWFAATTSGCIRPVNSAATDIDPRCWPAGESSAVEYVNDDSLSLRDIYLILRIYDNMDRRPVKLRVTTLAPDSSQTGEEITFDFEGARRYNAPVEAEKAYRYAARLSQRGTYRFYIAPADTLRGVGAVAIEMRNFRTQE